MKIEHKIRSCHKRFVEEHGHEPKYLYLGDQETSEYILFTTKNSEYLAKKTDASGFPIMEFDGLRVLPVHCRSHMNFS